MTGLDSFGDVLRFCGCAILASVCLLILRGLDKSGMSGAVSACQKNIFDKLPAFFKLLKSLKNGLIKRERQP